MHTRTSLHLIWLAFIAFAFASFFAGGLLHAQKPYSGQQRWTIGGDGSWDYLTVDSAAPPPLHCAPDALFR